MAYYSPYNSPADPVLPGSCKLIGSDNAKDLISAINNSSNPYTDPFVDMCGIKKVVSELLHDIYAHMPIKRQFSYDLSTELNDVGITFSITARGVFDNPYTISVYNHNVLFGFEIFSKRDLIRESEVKATVWKAVRQLFQQIYGGIDGLALLEDVAVSMAEDKDVELTYEAAVAYVERKLGQLNKIDNDLQWRSLYSCYHSHSGGGLSMTIYCDFHGKIGCMLTNFHEKDYFECDMPFGKVHIKHLKTQMDMTISDLVSKINFEIHQRKIELNSVYGLRGTRCLVAIDDIWRGEDIDTAKKMLDSYKPAVTSDKAILLKKELEEKTYEYAKHDVEATFDYMRGLWEHAYQIATIKDGIDAHKPAVIPDTHMTDSLIYAATRYFEKRKNDKETKEMKVYNKTRNNEPTEFTAVWTRTNCNLGKKSEGIEKAFKKFITTELIKNVYFNEPYTIVIWGDDTKTIVKLQKGEKYDPEKGLAMAISKKWLGNDNKYYDVFKKFLPEKKPAAKKKTTAKKVTKKDASSSKS